jgi:hypothetical protein
VAVTPNSVILPQVMRYHATFINSTAEAFFGPPAARSVNDYVVGIICGHFTGTIYGLELEIAYYRTTGAIYAPLGYLYSFQYQGTLYGPIDILQHWQMAWLPQDAHGRKFLPVMPGDSLDMKLWPNSGSSVFIAALDEQF